MISCRIFFSTQTAEWRHILFFNGWLDCIGPQYLILCGSYKPFSLFLEIPPLQTIPWSLISDHALTCSVWCNIWPWRGLHGLPLLNFLLSFLLLIFCLWPPSFSSFHTFSRSTLFLQWFHAVLNVIAQPHLLIANTLLQPQQSTARRSSFESRVGQHQLVDATFHKQLSVFLLFYLGLLVHLYFSLPLHSQWHSPEIFFLQSFFFVPM